MNLIVRKGGKKFFYWWIQKDLRRYLSMIEDMSLKKTVESKNIQPKAGSNLKGNSVTSKARGIKESIWNYGTFLMVNMYKDGQLPPVQETIEEEAGRLSRALMICFLNELEKEQIRPLSEIFPSPPYQLADNRKGLNDEAAAVETDEARLSILETIQSLIGKYNLEEFLGLIKREKGLQVMIQALISEYLPSSKKWSLKPSGKHYLVLTWHMLYQAANDIRRFSAKHQLNFMNDGEIRCLYNILNLYIHFLAVHGRVELTMEEREVIFAAAALHPLQDDYIDEVGPTKQIIEAISEKLKGNPTSYMDEKAKGIYDLIDVIYSKYPIKDNPMLVIIFSKLHEFQCMSEAQRSSDLSEEDLLHITFMKGGYAFAFFGYMATGTMSIQQFNHFFNMGAIFQILDDFHDIEDDLESGSTTVWTRRVLLGENLDKVLNATIGIQQYYEDNTDRVPDFLHPVLMRRFELFGIRYDIFRFFTMNQAYFTDEYIKSFDDCFPFPLDSPKKFYNSTRPYETLDTFLNILEEGKNFFEGKNF